MLKEVGASGQISLGKKYAGQLFEVNLQANGDIVMRPVKVVPVNAMAQELQPVYSVSRVSAQVQQSARDWAEEHAPQIDQYNQWATQNEPYSQRVRRWRAEGQGTPS